MTLPTQQKAKPTNQNSSLDRIQRLSDELIATAEAGDWTRLLELENEWLSNIKTFIVAHKQEQQLQAQQQLQVQQQKPQQQLKEQKTEQKKDQQQQTPLPLNYLENLLKMNSTLYRQCQQSRETLVKTVDDIRQTQPESDAPENTTRRFGRFS